MAVVGGGSNIESIALHTAPVLGDDVLAIPLRIIALGEEHALVPRGLFVLAHTAWLSRQTLVYLCAAEKTKQTLTFALLAGPWGLRSAARLVGAAGGALI